MIWDYSVWSQVLKTLIDTGRKAMTTERNEDTPEGSASCYPSSEAGTNDSPAAKYSPEPALQRQIGGSHYKDCKIQPIEFIEANALPFLEACVVKRVTRHSKPSGKGKQDIEKAIHELQLLMELRYGR